MRFVTLGLLGLTLEEPRRFSASSVMSLILEILLGGFDSSLNLLSPACISLHRRIFDDAPIFRGFIDVTMRPIPPLLDDR